MTPDPTSARAAIDAVGDLGDMVLVDGVSQQIMEVFVRTKTGPQSRPTPTFRPVVGLPDGVLTYQEAVAVEVPECLVCGAPGAVDCLGVIGSGYVLRNWRCSAGCCRILRAVPDA